MHVHVVCRRANNHCHVVVFLLIVGDAWGIERHLHLVCVGIHVARQLNGHIDVEVLVREVMQNRCICQGKVVGEVALLCLCVFE